MSFKPMSQEKFLQKCISKHGDRYDYSLSKYTHSLDNVKIICKEHGIFEQKPREHFIGSNCQKCVSDKRSFDVKNRFKYDINIPSNIEIPLDTMILNIKGDKYILIDKDDYNLVKDYNWGLHKCKNTYYGQAFERVVAGKQKRILLHRFIMNPPDGMVVDHINHNGLDNRRINLRICTTAQNAKNQKVMPLRGTSKYKGVCKSKTPNKWIAGIRYLGKNKYIGTFNTEEDAARAYDKENLIINGEYASLNFK